MNFKYYKTANLILLILILSVPFNYISEKLESLIKDFPVFDLIYSYIGVFSTVALITGTIALIDNYLWKWTIWGWKPLKKIIDIPNLNGRYKGELISSFGDGNTRMICVMEIKQTASKIKIYSYFGDINTNKTTSESVSVSEDLRVKENNTADLYYNFNNETAPLLDVSNHFGTSHLIYYSDQRLKGKYFNQKNNKGSIDISFQQKKLLGRLN